MFSKTDLELGLLSAICMAIPIFFINYEGSFFDASKSAFFQGCYSFFSVGFGSYLCRNFLWNPVLPIIIPSLVTFVLTYLMHKIVQSPKAFYSALYSFSIAIVSYTMHAWRFRRSKKTFVELIFKTQLFKFKK